MSYFLKFDKTFAIIPTEVNTPITIGFKVTPPAAAPEMMDPADTSQRKRFPLVSLECLIITPPLFMIEFYRISLEFL